MKKRMLNFIIFFIVLYASLVAYMAVFQRSLLYHPDNYIAASEQYGLSGFSEQFITNKDNISIQTWYRPARAGMPTIIYFHGNASHMGNRSGIYSALAGEGFGVFAISYSGYGKSGGSPSEQGLYADARAAIAYIRDMQNIPPQKIIIYGESLGSGVAVQVATENEIGGLVLQAPYTSVPDRGAEIYWFLPVKLVARDRFDSLSKIGKVKVPLLILHGEQDAVIPPEHGKKLLAAANEPKEAIFFTDVGHNNFDSAEIAARVKEFAEKYVGE